MLSNCGAEEDSWESLGQQGIKPVNPKGNQPWIITARTNAETEAPILWPPDVNRRLIGKDSDAGKDWRQKKGEEGGRGWDGLDSITNSMDVNLGKLWEIVRARETWQAAVHGVIKREPRLSTWTTKTNYVCHE